MDRTLDTPPHTKHDAPVHGSYPDDDAGGRLRRFLERLRSTVAHDLGTPLGTIANYSAILQQFDADSPSDVRDLGQRVGANAQRAARMIQSAASAAALAARPWRPVGVDPLALARVVLADAGGRGVVVTPAGAPQSVELDVEVLGFVWRAYVAVEQDARGAPLDEIRLDARSAGGRVHLDLSCGEASADAAATIDVQRFLRHLGGRDRLECAMAFSLASEVVLVHGGTFRVAGQPGKGSTLSLDFPANTTRVRHEDRPA